MSPQDWLMEQMMENGEEDKEDSLSEMKEVVAKAKSSLPNKHAQCGKWLAFEELYIPWSAHPNMHEMETRDAYVGVATSTVSLFGALASAVIMLLHTYRSLFSSYGRRKKLVTT